MLVVMGLAFLVAVPQIWAFSSSPIPRRSHVSHLVAATTLSVEEMTARAMELISEMDIDATEGRAARLRNAAFYALHPGDFWGDENTDPFLKHLIATMAETPPDRSMLIGLDIGANVGSTLDVVEACCGGAKAVTVVAFEPNPLNKPILQSVADKMPFEVVICEQAASDSNGEVEFYTPTGTDQAGQYFGAGTPGNPFGKMNLPGGAAVDGATVFLLPRWMTLSRGLAWTLESALQKLMWRVMRLRCFGAWSRLCRGLDS